MWRRAFVAVACAALVASKKEEYDEFFDFDMVIDCANIKDGSRRRRGYDADGSWAETVSLLCAPRTVHVAAAASMRPSPLAIGRPAH